LLKEPMEKNKNKNPKFILSQCIKDHKELINDIKQFAISE